MDDGFWEGELDGQVGMFPSLLVELLTEDGAEEEEEEDLVEEVGSCTVFAFELPHPSMHSKHEQMCRLYVIIQLIMSQRVT